jgi:hypothetical protein
VVFKHYQSFYVEYLKIIPINMSFKMKKNITPPEQASPDNTPDTQENFTPESKE